MNMQFIWWLTGLLATVAGIRFVILVFKRLTSKENMNALLNSANRGMHTCVDRVEDYLDERKKKKSEKDNRPIVTIR